MQKVKAWRVRDSLVFIEELSKGQDLWKISKKLGHTVEFLQTKIETCPPRFKEKMDAAIEKAKQKRQRKEEYIGKSNMTLRKRKRKTVQGARKKRKGAPQKRIQEDSSGDFTTPQKAHRTAQKKKNRIVKQTKARKAPKKANIHQGAGRRTRNNKNVNTKSEHVEGANNSKNQGCRHKEAATVLKSEQKSRNTMHTPEKNSSGKRNQSSHTTKKAKARARHRRRSDLGSQMQNLVVSKKKKKEKCKRTTNNVDHAANNSDKENEPSILNPCPQLKSSPKKSCEAHSKSSHKISPNLRHKYILKGKIEAAAFDPFGGVKRQKRTFSKRRQKKQVLEQEEKKKQNEIWSPAQDDFCSSRKDTTKSNSGLDTAAPPASVEKKKKNEEVKTTYKKASPQKQQQPYVESEDESESFCLAIYDEEDMHESSFSPTHEVVNPEASSDDNEPSCGSWRLYKSYLPSEFFVQRYISHHWSIARKFTEDPFSA